MRALLIGLMALSACNNSETDTDPEGTDPWEPPTLSPIAFPCPGDQVLSAGRNADFASRGESRELFVELPQVDAGTEVAVLFSFHDDAQSVNDWRTAFSPSPDQTPGWPVVIIYVEDMGLFPSSSGVVPGIGWDFFNDVDNYELGVFEDALGCAAKQFNIDPARVAVSGVGTGALVAQMVGVRYPKVAGTVLSWSGAVMSDPAQQALFNRDYDVAWAAPEASPGGGAVLLVHDASKDEITGFGAPLIDVVKATPLAVQHLNGAGRMVIDCAHDEGHGMGSIGEAQAIEFLKSHFTDEQSPWYLDGLPAGLADSCTVYAP